MKVLAVAEELMGAGDDHFLSPLLVILLSCLSYFCSISGPFLLHFCFNFCSIFLLHFFCSIFWLNF